MTSRDRRVSNLPSAIVAPPPPVPHWRQQPEEPAEAFAAFAVWVLADPPPQVPADLLPLADRWRWGARRAHLDQRLRDRVSMQEAMRDMFADATYVLCTKWRELASQVAEGRDSLKPRDTIALMQTLLQPAAAAFAAGQARQAEASNEPDGFLDMSRLTPDECATFAELHAKAWRRRE